MTLDQLALLGLFWMFLVQSGYGARYIGWVACWLAGIHLGLLPSEVAYVLVGWCALYYVHAALAIRFGIIRPMVVRR